MTETTETLEGRELILSHAERLFGERGYKGVSIRELAQACGMTNAALYYHFASKEDLFYEMVVRAIRWLGREMRAVAEEAGPDPAAQLLAVGQAYVQHVQRRADMLRCVGEAIHYLGRERAHNLKETFDSEIKDLLVDLLRQGQVTGRLRAFNAELGAHAFLALLGLFAPGGPKGVRLDGEDLERVLDLFLRGVMAGEADDE
ncbi:MAG: hypothetical protein Kow0047_27140 [Anaerolineae bacterium]